MTCPATNQAHRRIENVTVFGMAQTTQVGRPGTPEQPK